MGLPHLSVTWMKRLAVPLYAAVTPVLKSLTDLPISRRKAIFTRNGLNVQEMIFSVCFRLGVTC